MLKPITIKPKKRCGHIASDFQHVGRNERIISNKHVVTGDGRVRNFVTDCILKPVLAGNGYLQAMIRGRMVYIHRLVADAFSIPKPDPCSQCQIHHLDHEKQNNNVGNLIWLSAKDHRRHHADARAKHTTRPKRMGRPRNRNVVALRRTATQPKAAGGNYAK